MNRAGWIILFLLCSTLSIRGQGAADSIWTFSRTLDDINVTQTRGALLEQQGNRLSVDVRQLDQMPRFLGTVDPLRYLQSLAGVESNNETRAGIHIQGCDDYQSIVSINGAPVIYPNHLLGLFSTMIAPHFSTMVVEQSAHRADMPSRVGGLIDLQTPQHLPDSVRAEGTVGLIASDATVAVPIGQRSALTLSARASYLNLLYGRWMQVDSLELRYRFMDYNLTWEFRPTDRDRLTLSGFYSRDRLGIEDVTNDVSVVWQNLTASAVWHHRGEDYTMRHQFSFSGFSNHIDMAILMGTGTARSQLGELDYRARFDIPFTDLVQLRAGVDYSHWLLRPLDFDVNAQGIALHQPCELTHSDLAAVYGDVQYEPLPWLHTSLGIRTEFYAASRNFFGGVDPRLTLEFIPHPEHHIFLHAGRYHQYFHKAGLTGGGLPTDFFFRADTAFRPESAHTLSLRYQADLRRGEWVLSAEGYFKQLYDVVESKANVFSLINTNFNYRDELLPGDGRNYGFNLMAQRTRGVVNGYVSYSLGWARRKLPGLDGREDYCYSASHERRHDLKVVLNSRFAKRWTIGTMFVLASGIPCTRAEEVYLINGQAVCTYSLYNGYNLPLYHRLDLNVGCDIIHRNGHLLGINLSIYNLYNQKNAQFMVYRDSFRPSYGKELSFIIPSLSLYARW